jgi:hypothetical protein
MLGDPPELVGKRVRFLVTVKEESQIVATGLVTAFVGAVAAWDITSIPRLTSKE